MVIRARALTSESSRGERAGEWAMLLTLNRFSMSVYSLAVTRSLQFFSVDQMDCWSSSSLLLLLLLLLDGQTNGRTSRWIGCESWSSRIGSLKRFRCEFGDQWPCEILVYNKNGSILCPRSRRSILLVFWVLLANATFIPEMHVEGGVVQSRPKHTDTRRASKLARLQGDEESNRNRKWDNSKVSSYLQSPTTTTVYEYLSVSVAKWEDGKLSSHHQLLIQFCVFVKFCRHQQHHQERWTRATLNCEMNHCWDTFSKSFRCAWRLKVAIIFGLISSIPRWLSHPVVTTADAAFPRAAKEIPVWTEKHTERTKNKYFEMVFRFASGNQFRNSNETLSSSPLAPHKSMTHTAWQLYTSSANPIWETVPGGRESW